MKLIPLTQGLSAQVDDEDYDYLNQFKWHVRIINGYHSAIRKKQQDKKCTVYFMSRVVMGLKKEPMIVDHINHNTLDNRKCNLRIVTRHQNRMNCTSSKNSTSKYLGVHFHKQTRKWQAQVRFNLKGIYLGVYDNQEDAARAYDTKAKELFGEFANLNFKD